MKIIAFIITGILVSCCANVPAKQNAKLEKDTSTAITGRWKTVNAEFVPFTHISYCENLGLNTIFEFGADGKLKVYANEKTHTSCNGEQTYTMSGKTLQIVEDDMIFNYQVPKLTIDSLFLIVKYIPIETLRKMDISEKQLQKLKRDGFQLILIKAG